MKHAVILPTGKTLCGLDSSTQPAGWVFTEEGMKLRKGQQYSLFKDSVSCEKCVKIAKTTLLDETCEECGQATPEERE
jgi:hypothetical protein